MENKFNKMNFSKIKGITCDSRKVKPGFAFVAIKGFEKDGHNYIEEAINRGARLVFTEKNINTKKARVIKVQDTRKTLACLAARFFNFPSRNLNLIGVTGTNGKTTTTHLIYNLLNYHQKKSGLIGTVKVDTGKEIKKGDLTTPAPVLLQKYISEMNQHGLKYACMEVSSHGIKLKRILNTDFDIKVGTNISTDHLGLHDNFEDYIKVKKSFLKSQNNSLVLINRDDLHLKSLGRIARNQLYFGINSSAPIIARNIKRKNNSTQFIYHLQGNLNLNGKKLPSCKIPIETELFGQHNIYNSLIAITIGLYYDLGPEEIQQFFQNYSGVWRRMQIIFDNKFTVIDDCAHNPASYRAVFNTIKKRSYNKLIIITSPRGNRGQDINRENGIALGLCLNKFEKYHLLISSCKNTAQKKGAISTNEKQAFLEGLQQNDISYKYFEKIKPALLNALSLAQENDLILLLGPKAMNKAGNLLKKIISSA